MSPYPVRNLVQASPGSRSPGTRPAPDIRAANDQRTTSGPVQVTGFIVPTGQTKSTVFRNVFSDFFPPSVVPCHPLPALSTGTVCSPHFSMVPESGRKRNRPDGIPEKGTGKSGENADGSDEKTRKSPGIAPSCAEQIMSMVRPTPGGHRQEGGKPILWGVSSEGENGRISGDILRERERRALVREKRSPQDPRSFRDNRSDPAANALRERETQSVGKSFQNGRWR